MKNKKNTKFVILAGVVFIVIASVGLLYVNDVNVIEIVTSVATGNPFEMTEVTSADMPGSNYFTIFIHVKNNGDETHLVENTTIKVDGELISPSRWLSESYWLEPGQTVIYEVMIANLDNPIEIEWSLGGHTLYRTYDR